MKQLHKRAFLTHFELACEFALLICCADLVWLTHDIVHYGLNLWYVTVGIGLITGAVGTAIVLYRHHTHYLVRVFNTNINDRHRGRDIAKGHLKGYKI